MFLVEHTAEHSSYTIFGLQQRNRLRLYITVYREYTMEYGVYTVHY